MTEQPKQIGELELKMMQLIGESPKVINVPVGKKTYQYGVRFSDVKEKLIDQNYTLDEINHTLNKLRLLGYIGEFGSPSFIEGNMKGIYCIALKKMSLKNII